jgi:branched-chain amino acid transport system permease protein
MFSDTFMILYQIAFSIGILILISAGLAVIFGVMRVINLAHGEFIMLGAYMCLVFTRNDIPFVFSVILSGMAVGAFGMVIERLLIRHLYGRLMDTLLATWGLSLLMIGLVTTVFGPQEAGVEADLGIVSVGGKTIAGYNLALILIAFFTLAVTYVIWRYTKLGLVVRGAMENANMAAALGIDTRKYYMITFAYGSALTGIAGAILSPIVGTQPTMGLFYVVKAFVAVITGGPLPVFGTLFASGLYGTADGVISLYFGSVLAEICILVAAIMILRFVPAGITGHFRKGV